MASLINVKKKELLIIYLLSALFSGGRLFVGAISVIYVLSHGVSIGEFATIKSVQVATFLILDIPSGIFIKRIGYRKSILLTFFFSILGLFLYITGTGFASFIFAEFILAISLCMCPAAFADYVMEFLKRNPDLLVEKIFHRNEVYTSIANIVCGAFGGYLFSIQKSIPYGAGIFVQGCGLILAYFMISKTCKRHALIEKPIPFLKNSLKSLKLTQKTLLLPIFLLFIIQLTIQPLYHYWQPLFYEINPNISSSTLGFLFMCYSLCSIILNLTFSKLVRYQFFRSMDCILFLLLISSGFYVITAISDNEKVAFASFACLQGLLFTTLTCISAIINKSIENDNRPVILKSISFLARLGMLTSFTYIQFFAFLNGKSDINGEVHTIYLQACLVLFGSIITSAIFYYSSFKKYIMVYRENYS